MNTREKIITNYIEGYNEFDVEKMVADFDDGIKFENIQNGEIQMSLSGINEFKLQAENVKAYFSERKQTIQSIQHREQETEIEISYIAILAMDFPNGMKKGETLQLKGKSVFVFDQDKIIKLIDIS